MMQSLSLEQIIRIGARGSPLSLAQSGQLRAQLAASLGIIGLDIDAHLPLVPIVTTGDRIQDRPLSEAGGKGLFTKELDDALLDGRIDCAIHSLKDVPTTLPKGIVLLAGPAREDRRDALVTLEGKALEDLKQGAIIGTASLRRASQLLHARPDLQIVSLRGNVGTRLDKLRSGMMDATLLAAAGLHRLGLSHIPHMLLDPATMPPAIGQGALAITARAGDMVVAQAFATIADPDTLIETSAERAFLTALDGSCKTAIGACARLDEAGTLHFIGEALSGEGALAWRETGIAPFANVASATALGTRLGLAIKAVAGGHV
jgi:hydroxymethylbilane synthase